ncbi:neuropeptide FF receptor 2-like [Montipora foliosa]|uniref:neuropeptide FF receptor 2-like n=1 Tax=Montipora foliosa TaxID=591990 RepID=UPI0035F1DFBE
MEFILDNSSIVTNTTIASYGGSPNTPSFLKSALLVSYGIICVFGIFGNLMVIVASRKPRMLMVSNVLVANLATADFTVSLVNIPTVATYGYLVYWPFGAFLCKVVPYLQGVTLVASVGTLVAIAAERYWHVVLYKRPRLTVHQAYKATVVIWLMSLLIPSPIAIFSKTIAWKQNGEEVEICIEEWPNVKSRQVFTTMISLLLYFIPVCVICSLYLKIVRFLRSAPPAQRVINRAQRKATLLLLTVALMFVFCWMPFHVVSLYVDLAQAQLTRSMTKFILFSQWLVFANSACNPFFFTVLNHNYRREFKEMICARPSCMKRKNNVFVHAQNDK